LEKNGTGTKGLLVHQSGTTRASIPESVALLSSLSKRRFTGCRKTVTELRDLWRSWPELSKVGIAGACDDTLNELPEK